MDVTISNYAWFLKSQLKEENLRELRKRLTIKPKRTHRKQENPEPIKLYSEEDNRIGIPRGYFIDRRQLDHNVSFELEAGREVHLEFNGTLRPDQEEAVDDVMRNRSGMGLGGIIQALPGWGKTVVSLNIITKIGRSTLVVVNKTSLLKQWRRRILGRMTKGGEVIEEGYIPGARVGMIRGDKWEYGLAYDISIAMIQTLAARKDSLPDDFWKAFGLVVTDECHRVGAPAWNAIVPSFPAAYRLGVTATPRRKDRAESCFFWNIGEIVHESKTKQVTPKLRRILTKFSVGPQVNFNPYAASRENLIRRITKDAGRNELIIDELEMAAKRGRKIIVLSERRQHLETLNTMFSERKPKKKVIEKGLNREYQIKSGFYVGGMKDNDLLESEAADVIWATYSMTSEGLDIPALDTAFLVTPISDVEQSVGRIMRVYDKEPPVVSDFIDLGVPEFARLWNTRREFYVKKGMYTPKAGDV